ncbi:MAG: class I SAM-dependent methyltransferase [Myxococcales bacterium]|nr:class I SAM-dependent methyltransferase [Myxococcales bacterium]
MKARHLTALTALGAAAAALYQWRVKSWPCPAWFIAGLENPYFQWVAGAERLMDRASVKSGMRVLDAGCGPGRLTLPLARRVGPTGRVVALDLQRSMLDILERRLAEQRLDQVEVLHAGLGDGALPEGAFDVAFLVTVLGEIPDGLAALREIRAALRPGGLLSLTEALPDPHYQTKARVRALAAAAGLQERELFDGPVAYTINLWRPA